MMNVSYNISPDLKNSLQKIENLRREILLSPLPKKTELRLAWEAMINRVYWSCVLSINSLSKAEIIKLLTSQNKKKLTPPQQEVVRYKKALDYLNQNWFVSPKPVTTKTIIELHDIACYGRLKIPERDLKQMLDYLQSSSESPVIQAAIAQIQIVQINPFADGNGRLSRLLALLFLYKAGWDFRGFLVLEEYWRRDLIAFKQQTERVLQSGNLTLWLEYFTEGVTTQLEKALQTINSQRFTLDTGRSFWEMNDRQKEILTILEQPETTITNKKVQRMFKVSQITASRDLSKLTVLGILFSHGKGRSVYYTRA